MSLTKESIFLPRQAGEVKTPQSVEVENEVISRLIREVVQPQPVKIELPLE